MTEPPLPVIPVSELRPGHYVLLDLGWMEHPFPRNQFRITSEKQIESIRALGLSQVRIDPARSELSETPPVDDPAPDSPAEPPPSKPEDLARQQHLQRLAEQQRALRQCERRYQEGTRAFRGVLDQFERDPQQAGRVAHAVVAEMLGDISAQQESAIRLLGDVQGERAAQHAMNVTVLALLLARAMRLEPTMSQALGVAAFLHDMGKQRLPDPVRERYETLTPAQLKAYQEHVLHSAAMARAMQLDAAIVQTILEHHEAADGSGYPRGLQGASISAAGHILALINRYDGLCNPPNPVHALTPHEALSRLFATQRQRFDALTLNALIKMLGVYPPGSIVQLSDGRFAQVQVANAARPLKPRVLVHDPRTPRSEALLLDLETEPALSIQRSLRAEQLPRAALDYLDPRPRICYFFERAADAQDSQGERA
jgi:putative nucleotidyltransferase with HDIG domain